MTGSVSTDVGNSRRPTAKMPPERRISSSFSVSGSGSYVLDWVTFLERARIGIVSEAVSVASVTHGVRRLHDLETAG